MGRAALDSPDNTDHLNNYAAFLVMGGAEPQAVPILQKLRSKYPENTTVLNNLAQAWYGLGDVDEANRQIEAVLRRFPAHSQANYTKAEILEAKGDKAGAAAAIAVSAQEASSDVKARMAKRLGKALPDDMGSKPPRQPADTLGLQRIPLPDFCSGIDESASCAARWKAFHEAVALKVTAIQQRMKVYEQEDKALEGKSQAEQMKASIERNQMTASRPFAVMADRQKRDLFERSKTKPIMGSVAWRTETEALGHSINLLGLDKNLADINRRFANQFGEGKSNPFEAQCAALRGTYDKYVKEANGLAALSAARLITTNIPYFNEDVHLSRFMMSDRQFERYKLQMQLGYLSLLSTTVALPGPLSVGPNCPAATPVRLSANLQDFYDLKCDHVISFSIPKIGSWEVRCNRMTLNVNASIGPVDLAINRIDDLDNARVVRGRVEVGTSKSTDVGPIEVNATGSAYVEFDGTGVSSVGARGGLDVGGVEVAAGDAQFGWNAGGASDFKGELSGLATH
jgi:tetratricopeptide (TPR) repeat protein